MYFLFQMLHHLTQLKLIELPPAKHPALHPETKQETLCVRVIGYCCFSIVQLEPPDSLWLSVYENH